MPIRVDRLAHGLTLVVGERPAPTTRRADGIHEQPDGSFRVRVSVGPRGAARTAHKRFPASTLRRAMRDWQATERARLLGELPLAHIGGTLASDVARYVASLPPAQRDGITVLLRPWVDAHGAKATVDLSRGLVQQTLALWRLSKAASTVNHRKSALARLYRTLFPDHTAPTTGVPRYAEPRGEAPALTMADVQRVLDGLPERDVAQRGKATSRAAWFLRVFAATGMPPARIGRVRPEHLRLDAQPPMVFLEPRRKGRGTVGRFFPLTAAGAAAWRGFAQAQCFGPIAPETLYVVWKRGCKRAGLAPIKPYALRHVIAAEFLRRANGDVYAVADLLDVTLDTALRYARAGVSARVTSLIEAMNREGGS